MNITDELREWADKFGSVWIERDGSMMYSTNGAPPSAYSMSIKSYIWEIADNIDVAHRSALEKLAAQLDESEDGWVRLPVDADGVPINFGDVLDQFGTPMTVFAMSDPDPDQGDCMLELITDGISDGIWVRARKMRHYHAPTALDTLLELLNEYRDGGGTISEARLSEFAARLRLREENE